MQKEKKGGKLLVQGFLQSAISFFGNILLRNPINSYILKIDFSKEHAFSKALASTAALSVAFTATGLLFKSFTSKNLYRYTNLMEKLKGRVMTTKSAKVDNYVFTRYYLQNKKVEIIEKYERVCALGEALLAELDLQSCEHTQAKIELVKERLEKNKEEYDKFLKIFPNMIKQFMPKTP